MRSSQVEFSGSLSIIRRASSLMFTLSMRSSFVWSIYYLRLDAQRSSMIEPVLSMPDSCPECIELEFGASFGSVTSRADRLYIGNVTVGLVGLGDVRPAGAMALLALNVD